MHLEEFAEGNSFLHRLDPRVKFLTIIPYILVIAIMHGQKGPLAALAFSTLLVALARLDMKKLINRLVVVNVFVFLLWAFIPFSYPGETVFHIGPLTATREGMLYTLSITLKTNAIVLATIAILGTSEIFSLAHALVHLKVPDKLVPLFFFFYRYISVLHGEYGRLRNAMIIRCFRAGTNMHTYRTYAYLVGMLIVKSYERSQRIYQAMLCRGFKGRFPVMTHFRLRKGDVVFGLSMAAVTVLLVII
ncbi:energy-coupling factor transporter transmembrane protein EcfT [bacterium BMS3Abin08]|nr:energy-coupling factor transporter transmembrane protein EcfT [bacterium BMS3Abin08]